VALTKLWAELEAVTALNDPGVSSADSEDWKVESALLSVPSAEIFAVTAWVWFVISDCCGASVAATNSDTSELTLMTEPPAAPELLLLATETGVVSGEPVELVLVAEVVGVVVVVGLGALVTVVAMVPIPQ